MKNISFRKQWFLVFLCCLGVETAIAIFVHDGFIRPFIGDMLVIWLMFTFFKSFLNFKKMDIYLSVGIFLFACLIEVGQHFGLASLLNLSPISTLGIAIGATFDWLDILTYAIATLLLLIFNFFHRHSAAGDF